MENPLQALAVGSAIAFPVLRLVRAIPLPMLLVGAGFALSSSKVRDKAAETLGPALEPVKEFIGTAAEKAQGLSDDALAKASDLSGQALQKARDLSDTAATKFDAVRGRAAEAAAGLQPSLDQAKATAADLQTRASETLEIRAQDRNHIHPKQRGFDRRS